MHLLEQATAAEHRTVKLPDLPGPWTRSLVKQHLPSDALLQLFRTSRSLSAAVLRQQDSISLTLDASCEQGLSKQQLQARRAAVVSTLSAAGDSCSLRVVLSHGISTVWAVLPKHRITHLTLQQYKITARSLSPHLQLQSCTSLHTLSLAQGCTSRLPPADLAALQQQRSTWLPPSLTALIVDLSAAQYAGGLIQLMAPQLTSLTVPGMPCVALPMLRSLTRFETKGDVSDSLLSLTQLTHVAAGRLNLQEDHSSGPCNWQQLTLVRGAYTSQLQRLPVQHLKALVINDTMTCDAPRPITARVACGLSNGPALQCVPCTSAKLPRPYFTMSGQYSPEMVQLCARSLPAGSALVLQDFSLPFCDLLDTLSHLPTNIMSVCFSGYDAACFSATIPVSADQQACWREVVAALPQHVREITLFSLQHVHECTTTARGLVQALAHCDQHKGVVVHVAVKRGWGQTEEPDVPASLQQLVDEHPQHIQLRVFPCNLPVRLLSAPIRPKQ